ncbi:MAG: PqqD family peptide modification chaperone [Chitinivibrionales bacterium]|nr:PqqD family peptide modification chaperone [Chitinivibrionales bacterium]
MSVTTKINPDTPVSIPQILDAVPTRNSAAEQVHKNGSMIVRVPMRKRWYMNPPVSWLFPFSRYRRISLDTPGQEVWEACDGMHTMEQIIDKFAVRHFLSFHEARLSVMEFVRQLMRRGMLVLVGYNESSGNYTSGKREVVG